MSADLQNHSPDDARLRTMLVADPGSVAGLYQMVCRLYSGGLTDRSLAWGKRLLAIDPGHVRALSIAIHSLWQRKQLPDLIATARRCLAQAPDQDRIWACLAQALQETGPPAAALAPARHAATLRPDNCDALNTLSLSLINLKRFDEAKSWLRQALAAKPDRYASLMNLATTLYAEGKMELAVAVCRRVLTDRPDDVEALVNLGTTRQDQGRSRDAIVHYRRAVALSPGQPKAHLFAAMAYLRLGVFSIGWDLYEWRGRHRPSLTFPGIAHGRPCWDGGDITGKTILLHSEQGLGDTLQFCRYVPLVAEKAKVVLAVQGPLRGLLASLGGNVRILRDGERIPQFDLHCPLMSLPRLFRTATRNVPRDRAYLRADPQRLAAWHRRLDGGRGPRIGLAWSGNPGHYGDSRRSLPLRRLLPLFWNSGADWHVVQKDLREDDRPLVAATPNLTWHGDHLADFDDTAALVSALDLVIAVDTSVAHLAGALGVPTWLMLPYACDWRWLEDRDDSPWYASVRLFRQPRPDDWDGVIARIAEHLAAFSRPAAPPGRWDSEGARQARA